MNFGTDGYKSIHNRRPLPVFVIAVASSVTTTSSITMTAVNIVIINLFIIANFTTCRVASLSSLEWQILWESSLMM